MMRLSSGTWNYVKRTLMFAILYQVLVSLLKAEINLLCILEAKQTQMVSKSIFNVKLMRVSVYGHVKLICEAIPCR